MKRLSLIIPTNGRRNFVPGLMAGIRSQNLNNNDLEILIILNQSKKDQIHKDFLKGLQSFNEIHFLELSSSNVSRARNLGISEASGEYLYLLDDDCLIHQSNHFEIALNLLNSSKDAFIGGPYLIDGRSKYDDFYNRMCQLWVESHKDTQGLYRVLLGGNFCGHKDLFKKLTFNESFTSGAEETDFFQRATDLGMTLIYEEKLKVSHIPHKSKVELFETAIRQGYSRPNYYRANYKRNWTHFFEKLEVSDLKYMNLGLKYFSKVLIHDWFNRD